MSTTRRQFLKTAAATAAVASTFTIPAVHAAENNTIHVGIVGCGSRGSGALLQALSTEGPVELVSMADAFEFKTERLLQRVVDARPDRLKNKDPNTVARFHGLHGYKACIDALNPGDVVILTTPTAFRHIHFRYAVERGIHVFLEKSFAVDTPGIKHVAKSWEIAQEKGLKVMTGLNNRKYFRTEDCVDQIHNGAIGDITGIFVYRCQEEVPYNYDPNKSTLQNQLLNFNSFTWVAGSPIIDWMIHNIDIGCWSKNDWPVWCQGVCGRSVRTIKDQAYDHSTVEYHFKDGVRMVVQQRQIPGTWWAFKCVVQGTKGMAVLGEGHPSPCIYKGFTEDHNDIVWRSEKPRNDSYQEEHNRLFRIIREDLPNVKVDEGIKSAFAGIMGRMALESGQEISYDKAWNSEFQFVKDLDALELDSPAPIEPDADGNYPQFKQGITRNF